MMPLFTLDARPLCDSQRANLWMVAWPADRSAGQQFPMASFSPVGVMSRRKTAHSDWETKPLKERGFPTH